MWLQYCDISRSLPQDVELSTRPHGRHLDIVTFTTMCGIASRKNVACSQEILVHLYTVMPSLHIPEKNSENMYGDNRGDAYLPSVSAQYSCVECGIAVRIELNYARALHWRALTHSL